MSSGLAGAADSTDTRSHSFESSTENTIFQSRSWTPQETCNIDRSNESNEDKDTESSLESENTNDIEGKKKKSSREKMKEMLSNQRNKKLRKNIPIDEQILALIKEVMEIKHEMLEQMELQNQQFYGSVSRKHVHLHEYPSTVNTNYDCII